MSQLTVKTQELAKPVRDSREGLKRAKHKLPSDSKHISKTAARRREDSLVRTQPFLSPERQRSVEKMPSNSI